MASHHYTGEPPKSFDPPKRRTRVMVATSEQKIENYKASIASYERQIIYNQRRLEEGKAVGFAAEVAQMEIDSWMEIIFKYKAEIERLGGG